jgi:hypothetical protein
MGGVRRLEGPQTLVGMAMMKEPMAEMQKRMSQMMEQRLKPSDAAREESTRRGCNR